MQRNQRRRSQCRGMTTVRHKLQQKVHGHHQQHEPNKRVQLINHRIPVLRKRSVEREGRQQQRLVVGELGLTAERPRMGEKSRDIRQASNGAIVNDDMKIIRMEAVVSMVGPRKQPQNQQGDRGNPPQKIMP